MRFALALSKKSQWVLAVLLSLVFNGALFSIMPWLISETPGTKISPQTVHTVSVIRVKRPEAPPKKKAIQRQTPEENVSPKKIQKEIRPRKKTTRFKMPFELNVKLPQGQGNIPTLYMEKYALDGIEVYGAGEIDQPIVAIVRVPPIYPIRARRLGIEGFVTVKLLVNEKGMVEQTKILEANPDGVFDKSVLQCAPLWKFTPGTIDGTPVKTFVTTTIRFNLEDE